MADSRAGVCYIWLISSLLFVFTVAGGVFLVLYMVQPTYTTTSWYPIIGVSLVCFPWVFWLLTILYRIVSRACGFRMSCFNPSVADHPVNRIPSGGSARNSFGGGGGGAPIQNVSVAMMNGIDGGGNGGGGGGGNLVNENGNRNVNENRAAGVGSPKRVHFGGVVVLGEDDGSANENRGRSESLPSPASSSSSSDDGDESEMPLKLSMA